MLYPTLPLLPVARCSFTKLRLIFWILSFLEHRLSNLLLGLFRGSSTGECLSEFLSRLESDSIVSALCSSISPTSGHLLSRLCLLAGFAEPLHVGGVMRPSLESGYDVVLNEGVERESTHIARSTRSRIRPPIGILYLTSNSFVELVALKLASCLLRVTCYAHPLEIVCMVWTTIRSWYDVIKNKLVVLLVASLADATWSFLPPVRHEGSFRS